MSSINLPRLNPVLPEVYQIEASSACPFSCTMCARDLGKRKGENSHFPLDLAKKMVDRGDLRGSYFVEFQLSGEPLMNPQLAPLIQTIKQADVLVGMSTNGALLHHTSPAYDRSMAAIGLLDALTISVDSLKESVYEKQRVNKMGFTPEKLLDVIDEIYSTYPNLKIDLQVLEIGDSWQADLADLAEMSRKNWPKAVVRTAPDCFLATRGDISEKEVEEMHAGVCINPWMSVTVQSNGNVVSCCFDFHGDNTFGNLNDAPLKDIWASDQVRHLREAHMSGVLPKLCRQCYMRSPARIHMNLIKNWAASATSDAVRGTF